MTGQESAAPVLDVVVPVHNEQHTVGACVRRLHAHLVETFPCPFRITVADSASTDGTAAVARGLVEELPGVALVELEQKGRGRALKQVWLDSDALILAHLDVDLSTDLDALWPLVAPLMSGHSDPAIGSRLARGARVVRGLPREVISRCYNLVLRGVRQALGTGAWRQVRRFAAVGVLSTVLHLGLFAVLVAALGSAQAANLVALLLATLVNTGLNRRWTFGVTGAGRMRHQAQGLAVFGLTWAMTAGALALLHLVVAHPGTPLATGVLAVATALSTLVRFVAMRSWMFRPPAQDHARAQSHVPIPAPATNGAPATDGRTATATDLATSPGLRH